MKFEWDDFNRAEELADDIYNVLKNAKDSLSPNDYKAFIQHTIEYLEMKRGPNELYKDI